MQKPPIPLIGETGTSLGIKVMINAYSLRAM